MTTQEIQGTIEIKLIKEMPTVKEFKRFQKQHYTKMLLHPRFECRRLARQTLFNLNK
jgi:hypothetical protein